MAKNIRLLTDAVAEGTKPDKGKDAFLWDTKLKGFALIIRKSGVKTWIMQREVRGKTARQSLGNFSTMREEAARKAALKAFADMSAGFNPHEARDANVTFAVAFEDYLKTRVDLAPATQRLYRTNFNLYLEEAIGKTPVYELGKSPRRVAQLFADVTRAHGKGAANQVAQIVRMVYNRELEAHEGQNWPRNPVRAKTALFKMHKLAPRQKVIQEDAFPSWAQAVQSIENPLRRAGQLWMLLSGMRVNDVRTMRWDNITWEKTEDGGRRAKELFIPDPKGGKTRAYRLPLSTALATIIDRVLIYSTEDWAFGKTPQAQWCFPSADSASGHIEEFKEQRRTALVNPHALRRTFATVAADVVPAKHVSFLMNHALYKTITDAYQVVRPEALRRSQQSISDYIIEQLGMTAEDILGPIHSGTKQTYGQLPGWGRKGLIVAKRMAKSAPVIPH